MDSQRRHHRIFSCEFFPPNNDAAAENLRRTRGRLKRLRPAYYSVTYGAGGSTRNRTFEAVLEIQQEGQVDATPHLTCVASTCESLRAILHHYRSQGIHRIVALRGDMPSGMHTPGEFTFASELVAFIRAETGNDFHIDVAAYPEFHPEARSARDDLNNLKRKVDAGADSAITQFFYNPEAYYRLIDSCEALGLELPIVPGIMPITNFAQLARFSDQCGAEIPRWIRKRLQDFDKDLDAIREFGHDVVTTLCATLLDQGAPGLHFYTMNRAGPILRIWRDLGLPLAPESPTECEPLALPAARAK